MDIRLIEKQEEEVRTSIEALSQSIEDTQQNKSDFILEKFVVGQHDTPGRRYAQAILELQVRLFAIRRAQLEATKKQAEIDQMGKKHVEVDSPEDAILSVDMELKRLDLQEMELARLGNVRECKCLLKIAAQLVEDYGEFTYERLQQEEALYWQKRLARQATEDILSAGNISVGNRDAIYQMFDGNKHEISLEPGQLFGLIEPMIKNNNSAKLEGAKP
jgi:hypothetical protein